MGRAWWALGILVELLIASRQLGKLQRASMDAGARTLCPSHKHDGLLSCACQNGIDPACAYMDAFCKIADDPGAPNLPAWALTVLEPESEVGLGGVHNTTLEGPSANTTAVNVAPFHVDTHPLSAVLEMPEATDQPSFTPHEEDGAALPNGQPVLTLDEAGAALPSGTGQPVLMPGEDGAALPNSTGQPVLTHGEDGAALVSTPNSTVGRGGQGGFSSGARAGASRDSLLGGRDSLLSGAVAAALLAVAVAVTLGVQAKRRCPHLQQGGVEAPLGREEAAATATAAIATTPGCVGGSKDGYDYLDLEAWAQDDQYVFAPSTVRRSGRLSSKRQRRGMQERSACLTPAAALAGPAWGAGGGEDGRGALEGSGRAAGRQEESVWVRSSRGVFLGGVPSLLRSPAPTARGSAADPAGMEDEEGAGSEWSPTGGRILRLRWEPPQPDTRGDTEVATVAMRRDRSTSSGAGIPALGPEAQQNKTPARALRGKQRQSAAHMESDEEETYAKAGKLSSAIPLRGSMTSARKPPRNRGQIFWA